MRRLASPLHHQVHWQSQYTFNTPQDTIEKTVHWYLMMADSYYSKPQREEYFVDSGYYKFYEAYHLLKFSNEKQILEKAYNEYLDLKRQICGGIGNTLITRTKRLLQNHYQK